MTDSNTLQVSEDASSTQIFVGKNYAYYAKKWDAAIRPGSLKGYNVAAFFLGVFWLVYRKMYQYAAIFMGLIALDIVIESLLPNPLPDAVSHGINIGIAVAFGALGNTLYKTHVDKKVKEITANFPPEQVAAELAKQGGVNPKAAWGFAALVLLLVGLVIWILISNAIAR